MKTGDKVMIYQDPLTEKMPEGEATLLRRIGERQHDGYDGCTLERWRVRFDGETEPEVERSIKVKPANPAPLSCPVHGQLSWDHVTTMKTCGLCMEEQRVDASRATRLIRL